MKINEAFVKGKVKLQNKSFIDNPSLESQILLCHALKLDKNKFIQKKDTDKISIFNFIKFLYLIKKRSSGENIFNIIKKKYFYTCEFFVNKHVLTPRPETELIIDIVKEKIKNDKNYHTLDIGTGSGCIAITIAKLFPNITIDAVDISKKALKIAKKNSITNNIDKNKICFLNKDIFKFSSKKNYDIILSNPPYIKKEEVIQLKKNKIITDPLISLEGGNDGLKFYYIIKDIALKYLNNNGYLIIEHGINQRENILNIFKNLTFFIEVYNDLSGIDRVIVFQKRG